MALMVPRRTEWQPNLTCASLQGLAVACGGIGLAVASHRKSLPLPPRLLRNLTMKMDRATRKQPERQGALVPWSTTVSKSRYE